MIEVYPELQIYAPTAFSPNNDQLNDTFKLFGVGLYGFQVYIFSSGGTQIFYSDNIEHSWDGNYLAEKCKPGVYTYIVIAKDWKGMIKQKKGTLSLLR
ncbi:MAG: gliding motility-associated C-terminal domain-containing protein [Bacteroidales bacterium]|nr:gliding motility-associated C-terminal domain-containing protein [Bacteroidales bacterium]